MLNESICVSSFTKIYSAKTRPACDNLDFSADTGSVTGILGPNGAGKSTLLKALSGVHYPTSGFVSVFGLSEPAQIRKTAGFVPEVPQLDRSLTVKETLFFEAALYGLEKEEAVRSVEKVTEECSLSDVFSKRISSLSKGYCQRVSLAKALCHNPRLLILDEFSGGLDPAQAASVRKTIAGYAKKNAVILSTHRIEEAERLCSKIYILSAGTVLASGTAAEISTSCGCSTLEEAYLKLCGTNAGGGSEE